MMDKYIGRLLDNRYEILEVIGTGGMAVVYKARCHRLNRLVAVKILKDDFLEDEDFRRRFHSESQAVAMLSHPNIVSVYDVSSSVSADYIVMELIEGISLKQYMEKKGVLNWKETLHFAIQIAKALEHAHSRGIVHRDIKPHNVMVLKNGSVKVTDFGIARMMSKGNTLTKEALGSVHYISPEQAKGGRVDNRSDIYSLGVVMYEMMTGRPPYDGESPVSVAIQHINGGAVMPSTLNPNIPGGLEQIIMKAMAHDPSDRYPTATKMLADMDEFRKEPTMLFDYNTPPLDAVTRITKPPLVLNPTPNTPPRTTAERVARSSGGGKPPQRSHEMPARPRKPEQRQQRGREEPRQNSNVAVIAIIICALVAVVAIGVFVVILLGSAPSEQGPDLIAVPQLVGEKFDELPIYDDLQIRLEKKLHDSTYEAGIVIDQDPVAGTQVEPGKTVLVTVSLGMETKPVLYMEDLANISGDRAKEILNSLNLNLNVVIQEEYSESIVSGNVIRTEPAAGKELTDGQTITLWISKGEETKTISMPNLEGMSVDRALTILKNYGFPVPEIEMIYSNVSQDEVVSQSVERNTKVELDTVIKLEVSKGPEPQETTQPETTAPPEIPVKKNVTFQLPADRTEEYEIKIYQSGNLISTQMVKGDATSVTVSFVGTKTQECQIRRGDEILDTKKVDFTSHE